MHDSSLPQVVGGYRLGRRVGEGRFLGHALAPALVEIVFLDALSVDEQRTVCAEANDFSSLPDGGRVAILPRTGMTSTLDSDAPDAPPRLATPPDLRESWRHLEEAAARAAQGAEPVQEPGKSLLIRVTGILTRARRGPVMLAVVVGIVAVLAVVLLSPALERSDVSSSPSELIGLPSAAPSPRASAEPAGVDITPTSAPLTPTSTLGDFVLVHVPARDASGTTDVAVLERDGDTWVVRETYPDSATTGNETG